MTEAGPQLLLALAAGFGVWAASFAGIYAVQGFGCAYGWDTLYVGPMSLHRIILMALALGATLATFFVAKQLSSMRKAGQEGHETAPTTAFVLSVAACAAYVAVPATLFTFSGVLMTSLCS